MRDENDRNHIAYSEYIYLEYLVARYRTVFLICPVSTTARTEGSRRLDFPALHIVPLPDYASHSHAVTFAWQIWKTLKSLSGIELFYCRVPDPLCWMPKLLLHRQCIMHFVGDTIDATSQNHQWSWVRRIAMIAGYLPEYLLTMLAARHSVVYANGNLLSRRISRWGVRVTPVISSTIIIEDFDDNFPIQNDGPIHLIFVGYLRAAKGIHTLLQLVLLLKANGLPFVLHIVGSGEMKGEIEQFVSAERVSENVVLHGHIDDRTELNKVMRSCALFIFPSHSEGSPRAVLEAMAQGVPVISTPVGSLPEVFTNGVNIRFVGFNSPETILELIVEYARDKDPFLQQRNSAFNLVRSRYTRDIFLETIFATV